MRSFELEGVAADFLDEAAITRVARGGAAAIPADAVLLCAWGETGLLPAYLARFAGGTVVTLGREGFTDPAPGCPLPGWEVAAEAEFGDTATVYRRLGGGALA